MAEPEYTGIYNFSRRRRVADHGGPAGRCRSWRAWRRRDSRRSSTSPCTTSRAYSLPDERGRSTGLGMTYVHIPVLFESPTEANLLAFCDAMDAHRGEKVLVHCAANMRVTAFLGLYRTRSGSAGRRSGRFNCNARSGCPTRYGPVSWRRCSRSIGVKTATHDRAGAQDGARGGARLGGKICLFSSCAKRRLGSDRPRPSDPVSGRDFAAESTSAAISAEGRTHAVHGRRDRRGARQCGELPGSAQGGGQDRH